MIRATVVLAAAAMTLALAAPALAGGWAVTTFENLPESFEAGATYSLDYTIRQHGKTPVDSGDSYVMFRNADRSLRFDAANHGDGTYTVKVTLPAEGSWQWDVTSAWWGTQELGNLDVGASAVIGTGPDLVAVLKVVLPLATLIAAIFTLRQWTRTGEESPSPETG